MESKLWDSVCNTPKEIIESKMHEDGSEYMTVASIFRIERATKEFGAYGNKWGLKDIKHSVVTLDGGLFLATLKCVFFVNHPSCSTEFEIANSTVVLDVANRTYNYQYVKGLETDTINKALSRLGFFADLYSGDAENHAQKEQRKMKGKMREKKQEVILSGLINIGGLYEEDTTADTGVQRREGTI